MKVSNLKIQKVYKGMYAGLYKASGYVGTLYVSGHIQQNCKETAEKTLHEYGQKVLNFEQKEKAEDKFNRLCYEYKVKYLQELKELPKKELWNIVVFNRSLVFDAPANEEGAEIIGKYWAANELHRAN